MFYILSMTFSVIDEKVSNLPNVQMFHELEWYGYSCLEPQNLFLYNLSSRHLHNQQKICCHQVFSTSFFPISYRLKRRQTRRCYCSSMDHHTLLWNRLWHLQNNLRINFLILVFDVEIQGSLSFDCGYQYKLVPTKKYLPRIDI